MSDLSGVASTEALAIWQGFRARRIMGEPITPAVVELDPDLATLSRQ